MAQEIAADYHAEQRVWWLMMIPNINYGLTVVLSVLLPSFPWFILHGLRWWVDHVIHDILPWMGLVVLAYMFYRMLWYVPGFSATKDTLAYHLPIWRSLTRRSALARFYRALELGVKAGVDFPQAMNAAAQAAGNKVMVARLKGVETKMRAGVSLPDALAPCGFMTREARGTLGSAAVSGTFDQALPHLAQQTKASRDNTIRVLRFSWIAAAYVVTSVIVTIAAAKGYSAIYAAQMQRAGLEDLMK